MKRIRTLFLVSAVLPALAVSARERPEMMWGVSYNYGTEYRHHGVGVKWDVHVSGPLLIGPELIYFPKRDSVSMLSMSVNARYIYALNRRVDVYPLVGVNYSHWGYDGRPNASRWGVNIGGGVDLNVGKDWMVFGEARLQAVSRESQAVFSLGLRRRF